MKKFGRAGTNLGRDLFRLARPQPGPRAHPRPEAVPAGPIRGKNYPLVQTSRIDGETLEIQGCHTVNLRSEPPRTPLGPLKILLVDTARAP